MKTWEELEQNINYVVDNDIVDVLNKLDELTAADGDMPFELSKKLWELRPALFNKYYVKAWEKLNKIDVDFPNPPLSYNKICKIVSEAIGVYAPEVFEVSDATRMDAPAGGLSFLASENVLFSELDTEALLFDTENAINDNDGGNDDIYAPTAVVEYSWQDEYRCSQPVAGVKIQYLGSTIPESLFDFCKQAGNKYPWECSTVVVEVIRTDGGGAE